MPSIEESGYPLVFKVPDEVTTPPDIGPQMIAVRAQNPAHIEVSDSFESVR